MHYLVNFNGEIVLAENSKIPINHFIFSDAAWVEEKFRIFNGTIVLEEKHYFHLMAAMRMMRIQIPLSFTPEFIYAELLKLAESLGLQHAILSFKAFPSQKGTEFTIQAQSIKSTLFNKKECEVDWYREHHFSNGFLSGLPVPKPVMHVLKTYAIENSYDDLLITNVEKRIISTLQGSLFVINGNEVQTPKLTEGVKNDVWREAMLDILKKAPEYDVVSEVELSPFDVQKAQELFIVKESEGLQRITKFRKRVFETNEVEEIILPRFTEALNLNLA